MGSGSLLVEALAAMSATHEQQSITVTAQTAAGQVLRFTTVVTI